MGEHVSRCGGTPCVCRFISETEAEVATYRKILFIGLGILAVELIGAFASGSLALASDAGHVFVDLTVVGTAFAIAARELRRIEPNPRIRFFGACLQAVLLFAVAASILFEVKRRIDFPHEVEPWPLFAAAILGLVGNAYQYQISGKAKNRMHRGINVHIASDFACSSIAVGSGPLIVLSGWTEIDIIASCAIGIAIVVFGLPAILRADGHRHA